jgi:peptidoglycan-N-acetylglucosamine deacetylase
LIAIAMARSDGRAADRIIMTIFGIGVGVTVVLLAAGAVLWSPPDGLIDRLAARHPGCLYRVPARARLIALTVDDGPDPVSIPLILAELRRHSARATFFLISERIRGQEQLVRTLVADGHELGNHLTRDQPSIRLSTGEFARELRRAHQVLARHATVRWVRPGSGWYSRAMIETIEEQGYHCALGTVYPFDAAIPSATFASRYILRNARPGAIVILHDGAAHGRRTARVLRTVLPELRRRGYRVISLTELVAGA